MFDSKKFVRDVAVIADYAVGLKLLGFVLYIGEHGADALLAGELVSLRTYYRYCELVRSAGWGSLLYEVRAVQALREYKAGLFEGEGLQPDEVQARLSTLVEGV